MIEKVLDMCEEQWLVWVDDKYFDEQNKFYWMEKSDEEEEEEYE